MSSSVNKRSETSPTKKRQKRDASVSSEEEEDGRAGITPERAIDIKTLRRFRKGELVWFKIDTIHPPPTASSSTSTSTNKNLPHITHWPGLVAGIITRTQHAPGSTANPSLSAAWTIAGGTAPESLQPTKDNYIFEHKVRPLGLFDLNNNIVAGTGDLLPWAMGKELLGGSKGWEALGNEATRVLAEGVNKEIAQDKGKETEIPNDDKEWDERWKARWAQRWNFRDKPQTWEAAVFRLSMGLKIAAVSGTLLRSFSSNAADMLDLRRLAIVGLRRTKSMWCPAQISIPKTCR